ncbi:MAG TPA: two-component regulator propeller domain-containing protein [Saprospiraceae bacterium]|nr:two-component regulator propeller domain-containing protein [Saprospiraceae bacterium]HMQ81269.1 two-component regulator propeller domain-containing protein [Saprospiraceae bacterium]
MGRILYNSLFLWCLSCSAGAQTPFFSNHVLSESVGNAKLKHICEDAQGRIWFGTNEGLLFFNGIDYIPMAKQDTGSQAVSAIYQDHSKRLWVGYQDGGIYYLENQQLIPWLLEEGWPSAPITGFASDPKGYFWIATYGEGLYYHNGQHLYNINADDGLPGNDIYTITPDTKGRIWAGTDGGVSICTANKTRKNIHNISTREGLPDDIVRSILSDGNGQMWLGFYDKGFCQIRESDFAIHSPYLSWDKGVVNALELFKDRELWIGTDGKGLWRYSLTENRLLPVRDENHLDKVKVLDLQKDVEGNIWFIDNLHGVCKANRQFEFIHTPLDPIQAILLDSNNQVWLGTQSGLYQLDKLGEPKKYLDFLALNVISLYQDKHGVIWIGTFGQGLYCLQADGDHFKHLSSTEGLLNNNILSIAGNSQRVWLATLGGVSEINNEQSIFQSGKWHIKNLDQESGLGTNFIYKTFVDSKNRVWFGTDGEGVTCLENGKITNYQQVQHSHREKDTSNESGLKLGVVYSITEDHRGHIWLSTSKNGIFEFDGQSFSHLTVKEGIRDLAITSLVTDGNGNIIIVHSSGIDILDPVSKHLIYYDEAVGIKRIDPNLNAVCKDRFGDVWIGDQGTIIKYTALNEQLEIHPRTHLNGVSVFLEPINFSTRNRFQHDENHLVFEYIGLWYTDPETVRYRYKLEGYNQDWIESGDPSATYSNLPPGKYKFLVSSTENEAFDVEPVVAYSFEIVAPFWQQPWFIVISLLAGGVSLYHFVKSRDKRLQRVNTLEKERAESELAALKAQINPHFLFNSFNTLVNIIEENPHDAVSYVEKLSDFYRSIMQYRDKEVISLSEELELVNNYCYLLKKRFGNNFSLETAVSEDQVYLIPLTLQMLVENAVKHNVISKAKPLTVHIISNGREYITVKNNLQRKVQPEGSTLFGLQSLNKRYELLSGKKLHIEVSNDCFQVDVPFIK